MLDEIVINHYDKCLEKDDCFIDLNQLPFKWDEMYIFNRYYYNEADKDIVASVIGANYDGGKNEDNRSIIFLYKKNIVKEIITNYEYENFLDDKPMTIEFIQENLPINSKDAKFKINSKDGIYYLFK